VLHGEAPLLLFASVTEHGLTPASTEGHSGFSSVEASASSACAWRGPCPLACPLACMMLGGKNRCKFQSENVPEYKKKTGKNQGEKCTTAPSGLSASTLFLVISQSFADQLPQSSSLTRGELPGTRLLSNLV